MEFQIKGTAFKIQAANINSAIKAFREMAPMLKSITADEITLLSNEKKPKINVLSIPKEEGGQVISSRVDILAWDDIAGSRFAIVRAPNSTLYWVETKTNIMVSKSIENIPSKSLIFELKRKWEKEITQAKILPEDIFWKTIDEQGNILN